LTDNRIDTIRFSTDLQHIVTFRKLSINTAFTIAPYVIFVVELSDHSGKGWSAGKT